MAGEQVFCHYLYNLGDAAKRNCVSQTARSDVSLSSSVGEAAGDISALAVESDYFSDFRFRHLNDEESSGSHFYRHNIKTTFF